MRRHNSINLIELATGGFVVIAFLFVALFGVYRWGFVNETVIATVTDKGERCRKNESCKYLIYTDKGTLENTDSLLHWKWNSSDIYGAIKIGHQYSFETSGIRLGFLSWYPNINAVKEVDR